MTTSLSQNSIDNNASPLESVLFHHLVEHYTENGLPTAEDLDSIAEEEKQRERTSNVR